MMKIKNILLGGMLSIAIVSGFANQIDAMQRIENDDTPIMRPYFSSEIHDAVYEEDVEKIQLLIDRNGDINAQDFQGYTPLMRAIQENSTGVITKLLQQPQTDVNARNLNGDTALMIASSIVNCYAVEQLLEMPQIDVEATNNQRKTALMMAQRILESTKRRGKDPQPEHEKIVQLIEGHIFNTTRGSKTKSAANRAS